MFFYIKTLGCKVNQYESEEAKKILLHKGYVQTQIIEEADVVVINTCSVTHIADRKSRQQISKVTSNNSKAKIYITGCSVENEQANIKPIKNGQIVKKELLLEELSKIEEINNQHILKPEENSRVRKMIKIQNGCNYFCSYCIIPYVRSSLYSLPLTQIIAEIQSVLEQGCKEIVLTGINLGTYDYEGAKLENLVEEILAIDQEFRLRISSIEPNLISDKLIELCKKSTKAAKHFHVPLQATNDKMLKAMNRKYLLADYLKVVERLKGFALTTDLIVGFPGEGESDFSDTLSLIDCGMFQDIHLFLYSKRQGTVAYEMTNHVADATKHERMQEALQKLAIAKEKYLARFLGKEAQVLVEEMKNNEWLGFNEYYQKTKLKNLHKSKEKFVTVINRSIYLDEKQSGFLATPK